MTDHRMTVHSAMIDRVAGVAVATLVHGEVIDHNGTTTACRETIDLISTSTTAASVATTIVDDLIGSHLPLIAEATPLTTIGWADIMMLDRTIDQTVVLHHGDGKRNGHARTTLVEDAAAAGINDRL